MEFKDYIRVLKRRFYVILITLLISVFFLIKTKKEQPRYFASSAEIIIKKPVYEEYYYLPQVQSSQGYVFSYQTKLYFLTSPVFLRKAAEKVRNKNILDKSIEEIYNILKGGISIDRKQGTEIIRISFTYTDSQTCFKILDAYINALDGFLRELNESTIVSSKKYLATEKQKYKKQLTMIRKKLKKYFDKSLVYSLSKLESKETKQLDEISAELRNISKSKIIVKEELNKLNNNIIPNEIKVLEPDVSKKYLDMKNEYEQLDLKIKEELLSKTYNHPAIVALMQKKKFLYDKFTQLQLEYNIQKEKIQKDAILDRKIKYINELQNLENLEYNLSSKYNKLKKRIFDILYSGISNNIRQFENLRFQKKMLLDQQKIQNKISQLSNQEQDAAKNLHEMTAKLYEMEINTRLYSRPIEVIEKPNKGQPTSTGQSTYWAAYILAGLLIGFVLAYLLEFTTAKIRTQFDVKKYINVPILVSIPKLDKTQISDESPFVGEIFNTASILLESWVAKNNAKLISVASATIGEGKTFVASNLALALARGNKKVILLDMDLRKPTIHKYLDLKKREFDYYNILNSIDSFTENDLKNAIERYNDTPMDVLYCRKSISNSSIVLKSDGFKKILDFTRREYEYIIMDSSPLNIIADGIVLASYSDGVILVIGAGAVEKADLYYTKFLLNNVGAKIIGTILNKTTYEVRPYYYYYRGYTYKYYAKKAPKGTREEV